MWLRHLIEAEKETRNLSRVFVTYQELLTNWKELLALFRVQRSFRFKWPVTLEKAGPEIDAFIENRLRHNIVTDNFLVEDKNLNHWIRDAYLAARDTAVGEEGRIVKTLTAIEAELKEVNKIYAPVLNEFWNRNHLPVNAALQEQNQQD